MKIWVVMFVVFSSVIICAANDDIGYPIFQYGDALSADSWDQLKDNGIVDDSNIHTYFINLKNENPEKAQRVLESLFEGVTFAVNERSRSLIFRVSEDRYQDILKAVEKMDAVIQQIKIEVKVVELNYQDFDEYRSMFSDLTTGFMVNYDFKKNKIEPASILEGKLIGLIKNGDAKIVAKPIISTVDNQKASIHVGDKIPYITAVIHDRFIAHQVNHVDTGIQLDIVPKVVNKNLIFAQISTSISGIKLWRELEDAQYPVVSSRKANTSVYIKNKETLVIAGLMDEQEKTNETSIPILGDLPFIGGIFHSKTKEKIKSDVLFMITPYILK